MDLTQGLPMAGRFRAEEQVIAQDWAALAVWLHAQGMALDLDRPPRQFGSGLANLNYLVSVDGRPAVLRRPPAGPTAEGANDMAREWRVLRGLAGHYPLAPGPVAFCDDPAVLGAPFQLIEYRPGRPIGVTLPPSLVSTDVGRQVTGQLIAAMTALHEVDTQTAGLGDLGRPDGFLRRQVEGWARRSVAAFAGAEPAPVATILGWLRAQQPPPATPTLLHCDLKLDNILFDLDTLTPVAIVDWDMATRGDPLFDLAVLLSYWIEPGDPAPVLPLAQMPTLEPGFPSRAEVAAMYFAARGLPEQDLGFHLALARFRLAIAWQQMYVHHRRGTLVGPTYADFGRQAEAFLHWTADTLGDPFQR